MRLLLCAAVAQAWLPQRPLNGSWTHSIEAELDRSLRQYARPANDEEAFGLAQQLLADPYRFVLILGDTLIADTRLVFNKKGMHHLEFVKSIIERRGHENVLYSYEWNADGYRSEDQLVREGCPTPFDLTRVKPRSWALQKTQVPMPRFVIAKRHGYDQCGLLVPNCYFDDLKRWRHVTKLIRGEASNRTFESRDDRAFWRGSIRTQPECEDEGGNYARTQAVALSQTHPSLFDVKCLDCDVRNEVAKPCPSYKFDEETASVVKGDFSMLHAPHIGKALYAKYKYQLNLPGSVSGSYSRNLNHLWSVGSAVLLWDAPFVEFYYPALSDGETHVSVARADAAGKLSDLRSDRVLQQKLLTNAERVSEELLCPACLEAYWRTLIDRYRRYFRLDTVLDDRATLQRLLDTLDVEALQLVALDVSTKWKLVQPRFITSRDQLVALADAATADPRATPAPARAWRAKRRKKKAPVDEDVARRAAKKWLRGVVPV